MTEAETQTAIDAAKAAVVSMTDDDVSSVQKVVLVLPPEAIIQAAQDSRILLALKSIGVTSSGTAPIVYTVPGSDYMQLCFRVTQKGWRRRANISELMVGIITYIATTPLRCGMGTSSDPWPVELAVWHPGNVGAA